MATNRVEAMDEWNDLLAAAMTQKRDDVVASLPRIVELEAQQKAIEQELNLLKTRAKDALADDPMPLIATLPDEVTKVVATLKQRNKPASIDLKAVADAPRGEEFLADAARALVLTAALTPLRALKGRGAWADALLAAEMPGGISDVLTIEVVK